MTSLNRKNCSFLSAILDFASVVFVVLIGCTAAALNQRPLNSAVEIQGQTSFVCSSDIGVPHWVYSSDGKSNRDTAVKSDYCSISPENDFHFQTQTSSNTCTLIVHNATKELAGVYTCIDGSSKSDRFSALLTVIDPNPNITVENQSRVFEGQTLNIVCSTSYAGPEAPAPPLAPSIYFSTSDGQRVSDVSVFATSEQVLASFSVAAKSPMVPSFNCNVFFPTVKETKQQYASNTPNNTYSWSSPVIHVSNENEFKTDSPLLTSTACKTDGCVENKQNASTSTDWQSNATNQSTNNATDGQSNHSAVTSAVGATTTLYPSGISGNESTNATDDYINYDDDDRTTNYTNNETNYDDTDFPDWNNMTSGTESSENSTDINIESERKTNVTYETTTYNETALPNWNNTVSNSTGTPANGYTTTNYTFETPNTTTHYEGDFPDWKKATSGIASSDNATDTSTNSTLITNYKGDLNKTISNSADTVADGNRTTNYTHETSEPDFPTLNTTVSGTESSPNFTGTGNDTTTTDHPIVLRDWNTTIEQITESTNFTGVDENENITARTSGVPTYDADDVSRNNVSVTRSFSDVFDFPIDSFLNSIFSFNETFSKFYRNGAPHVLKASFSYLVIAASIFLFFVN